MLYRTTDNITFTNRKVMNTNCLKNVKNTKILTYIAIPLAPILFMQGFQAKKTTTFDTNCRSHL